MSTVEWYAKTVLLKRIPQNSIPTTTTTQDFYGRECRDPSLVLTVESFKLGMTPEDRLALNLPAKVFLRLLELFVPPEVCVCVCFFI